MPQPQEVGAEIGLMLHMRETEACLKLQDLALSSEMVRWAENGPGWTFEDLGSKPTSAPEKLGPWGRWINFSGLKILLQSEEEKHPFQGDDMQQSTQKAEVGPVPCLGD